MNENTVDLNWIIAQQIKPLEEKAKLLSSSFAQTSEKLDFIRKSDGFNYVLGKLNIPENLEFRIWKTLDTPNRSFNPEYIYKGVDEAEAYNMFKSIIADKKEVETDYEKIKNKEKNAIHPSDESKYPENLDASYNDENISKKRQGVR